jgi:hypothetical protein
MALFGGEKQLIVADLVGQYVKVQQGGEEIGRERNKYFALTMGGENPQVVQEAERKLQSLDYRLEALPVKLEKIYAGGLAAIRADREALRKAIPAMEADLRENYLSLCDQAARAGAELLKIIDDLNYDRGSLVSILGLPGHGKIINWPRDTALADAFNRHKKPRLTPPDSGYEKTYAARLNALAQLKLKVSPHNCGTEASEILLRQELGIAIRQAGGIPPPLWPDKPGKFSVKE